jgi:hypothetical protein
MWASGVVGMLVGGVVGLQAQDQRQNQGQGQPQQKPEQKQQQPGHSGGPQDAEMAEMMKKWDEYGALGPQHKNLEPMVGKWNYIMKWWMSADAPAEEGAGTSEYKLIFDGRYLQQNATMPPHEGHPEFKGMGLIGYDNLRKRYESVWFDNMGTGMMVGHGEAEQGGKVIKTSGTAACPMSGQTDKKWRSVLTINGPDKHTFEMFEPGPDGKEFRVMEIVYTRAK